MKAKVFAMGLIVVAALMVAAGPATRSVLARQNANANKRAPRGKTGSASKASNSQAATAAATGEQPKPKKPARKHPKEAVGIPSGAGACVAKLEQLASKQPLTPYEKGPEQIINNGLLWNDPHSKCSVGSDQAVRNKVFAVATAWQQKDSGKIQGALAELKSSLPAETPAEPKKPRRHRAYAPKGAAAPEAAGKPASNSNSPKPKGKSGKGKSANKNSGT
jgi:hypothetical protein